jgi:hypothetical protein
MAKVVYIFYWKGTGKDGKVNKPIACTNKRLLSERSPLGYDNLVRIFTRQRRCYWEDSEHIIIKIYENDIIRGRQKISVRGRGGIRFNGSGGNRY